MNKLLELFISCGFLVLALITEWNSSVQKIFISDLKNYKLLIWIIGIVLFSLYAGSDLIHDRDEKSEERLRESVKKACMAFVIAYLAHLDLIVVPFWLVFIMAFFFEQWV